MSGTMYINHVNLYNEILALLPGGYRLIHAKVNGT